jgi:hypothetical protein
MALDRLKAAPLRPAAVAVRDYGYVARWRGLYLEDLFLFGLQKRFDLGDRAVGALL